MHVIRRRFGQAKTGSRTLCFGGARIAFSRHTLAHQGTRLNSRTYWPSWVPGTTNPTWKCEFTGSPIKIR
jgi:hypothetical protein